MKFYINEIQLTLVENPPKDISDSLNITINTLPELIIHYNILKKQESNRLNKVLFIVEDIQKATLYLEENFKRIDAAGGIVKNDKGEILVIHRLGKWDLPKGKIEKNEDIKTAALREVEEECGVKAAISSKLINSWHTYVDRQGRDVLKCTYWFEMSMIDDRDLKPQQEEDITDVKWMDLKEVDKVFMKNTYSSIVDVIENYKESVLES